jgi:CheY-like chemotaxis protein
MECGKPYLFFVDDEKAILDTLRTQLSDSPLVDLYGMEFAQSGSELLELLESLEEEGCSPVVVVSDQVMPGMRGDELLRHLHAKQPSLQTILLSGHADHLDVQRAFQHAALFRFVEKPWNRDYLIETLTQATQSYHDRLAGILFQQFLNLQADWTKAMARVQSLAGLFEAAAATLHRAIGLRQLTLWHLPTLEAEHRAQLFSWYPQTGLQPLYWLDEQPPPDIPLQQLIEALGRLASGRSGKLTLKTATTRCLGTADNILATVHVRLQPQISDPRHWLPLLDSWFQLFNRELTHWHHRETLQAKALSLDTHIVRLRQQLEAQSSQLIQVIRQCNTHKLLLQPRWSALEAEGFQVQLALKSSRTQARCFQGYIQTNDRLFVLGGTALGDEITAALLSVRVMMVLQQLDPTTLGSIHQLVDQLHVRLRYTSTQPEEELLAFAVAAYELTTGRLHLCTVGQSLWCLPANAPAFCQPAGLLLPLDRPLDSLYLDCRPYDFSGGGSLIWLTENLAPILAQDQRAAPDRLRALRQHAERFMKNLPEAESQFVGIGIPALAAHLPPARFTNC